MLVEVIDVLQWLPKWRSTLNSHYNTYWVSFPRVLGMGNPNLRSDRWLDVKGGRWCNVLQNIGQPWIVIITHVGCHFLDFWVWGIRIWGQIKDYMSLEFLEAIQWPPKWRSTINNQYNTCWVSFPRFLGIVNPNLRLYGRLHVIWGPWGHSMTSKMEVNH